MVFILCFIQQIYKYNSISLGIYSQRETIRTEKNRKLGNQKKLHTYKSCLQWNVQEFLLTTWLMRPEVQRRIHNSSPIIPILSRINPIPCIDTYLFKVHSNIVLLSTPRAPSRSCFQISLHSLFNVRDHVSQPCSTTANIIVLYIFIFQFLERNLAFKNYKGQIKSVL